ncbi:sialin isoform X2 [Bemisia tabaci]|uniref:sialin isoform X2 n=1 Tax=Bemisia tabaci TaxID=7038 RepID=UPI003B27CE85
MESATRRDGRERERRAARRGRSRPTWRLVVVQWTVVVRSSQLSARARNLELGTCAVFVIRSRASPVGPPRSEPPDYPTPPTMECNTKTDLPKPPLLGSKWQFWKQRRYLVAFLAFLGFFNVYTLRVNLSVAIVAMTTGQILKEKLENGTTVISTMPKEFDWDSKLQGLILSSFFYGYICTQLFGGWLGARIGGARVYGVGVAVTALLTLITPPLARLNVNFLIALRIIEGLFEGVTYPCIHAVWSQWAPPMERTQLASVAFSGSFVGTVVAYPVCGFLADKFGWSADFYIPGLVGLFWVLVWLTVVRDRPEDDPYISSEELKYIQDTLGDTSDKKVPVPWKNIVTSMPVWAIVCAHFCENWGFYTLLTQLPTFMKDTLNFNLAESGFLSALPYLVMALVMQRSGYLADWVRSTHLTTTQTRKLFNCTAFISQTIFMFAASYMTAPAGVIFCLIMAVGLGAFAWSAFSVNHLDIAPQYASLLMGFSNTFATIPGIISPMLAGYLVQNKQPSEWQNVFLIASGIYLFGAIFYGIFADGEVQPWAMDESTKYKRRTPTLFEAEDSARVHLLTTSSDDEIESIIFDENF